MSANDKKILRCMHGRARSAQRLNTYAFGVSNAPSEYCSEFCKRAAARELRHIIKYSELMRYYSLGGR